MNEIRLKRLEKLQETIRQAAKELLAISDFDGFGFPFGNGARESRARS